MKDSSDRMEALNQFNKAGYNLLNADSRLRGRATQIPGALATAHARALKSLVDHGDLTIKQLALYMENKSPAVTQLVNGMEKNGYVERIKTDRDRRSVKVRITPKGLQVFENYEAKITGLQEEMLDTFSVDELNTTAEILRRMSKIIDLL